MKLNICPLAICRTPAFSYHAKIENVWEDLKSFIEESSPAFFDIIKDYGIAELENLEPRAKFTIWKYFNRARFRATPYGRFAAFSIVPVAKEDQAAEITIQKEMLIHRFPDWSEKEKVNLHSAWLIKNARYLRANTSAYICADELRYVNFIDGTFELSEVAAHETALKTIQFCHARRTVKEVHDFLHLHEGIPAPAANYFIEQLIQLQLLFTDFHPNIIGNEYFKRIGSSITEKKDDYVIASRAIKGGQLQERSLQVLVETVKFLGKHIPLAKNPALQDFRNRFLSRFENNEIPLLTALDPEIGINYLSLEQDTDQNDLIEDLKKQVGQLKDTTAVQRISALQKYILDQMLQHQPVQLADFKGAEVIQQVPVANTMTALVSFADDLIVTEQFGGCTANALLGRFTMASDEVIQMAKEFVQIEEQANPDVLFFDIAYQAEKHVDNVNRRRSIYTYELPILTWTESANVIDLDDIMLSCMGEELILRSVKYGKRIIPRLASAYNYTRSDLTIFRFLLDLQQQSLQTSLSLSMQHVLPGLAHYPRIQYKNVVLSAATWLVPQALCNARDKTKDMSLALVGWLSSMDIQKPFKCGDGDQTLCFNPAIEEDRQAFLMYCNRKTNLYISEAFLPRNTVVKDENQRPYLSEFMVSFVHQGQLYRPYPPALIPQQADPLQTKTLFLPGGEWLYFEIYCHETRSNTLLMECVKGLIGNWRDKIKLWFFIRYSDPSNHIRLRFQLKRNTNGYELMHALSAAIEPYLLSGVVSDLQIKTYRPETKRYGASRMPEVERCFNMDSDLVLNLLKNTFQVNQLYALSLYLMEQVMEGSHFSIPEQLAVADRSAANFTAEMKIEAEGFKKINQSFKEFNNYADLSFMSRTQKSKLRKTIDSFLEALTTCPQQEKTKLLTDLFHMHVNRLFATDQRIHEMVIYHYLARILKIRIGRQKNMETQS